MGLIASIKDSISRLFSGGEPRRIGIYGPPNAGKCLRATEEVLLADGTRMPIESVFSTAERRCPDATDVSSASNETWLSCADAGIRVPALTESEQIVPATVSHVFRQSYDGQLFRVETQTGRDVVVSPAHPFIVAGSEGPTQIPARELSVGATVASVSTQPSRLFTDDTRLSTDGGAVAHASRAAPVADYSLTWDTVRAIEPTSYTGYIYDLTVPEHHTFTTGSGLVVHNTTLANRIARDWTGDAVGPESHVPHETRRARRKENVEIKRNGSTVTIDIVDTPGVTTKVDYNEFLEHDMNKEDAVRRSREATEGVAEAMHWLREDVDGVVYVLDSTSDPFTQVNTMLVGIIESRDLPVLIFANKIDLDDASIQRIVNAFPQHEVIPLSALEGENMEEVYDKIAEYFG